MPECPLDWLQINGTIARHRLFSSCEHRFSCDDTLQEKCLSELQASLDVRAWGMGMLLAEKRREAEGLKIEETKDAGNEV